MPQGQPVLTFNDTGTNFHFLVREHNIYLTREVGTIRAGVGRKFKGGTVLTRAGDGLYDPWVAASTNAVILMEDVDAVAGAQRRTLLVRLSEVQRKELFFTGTPSDAEKDTAYAQLAANHVVMR
jgi:hypothetical protein